MADDVRDQIHKLIRLQSLETEIRKWAEVVKFSGAAVD